jgi:hypothetical protein
VASVEMKRERVFRGNTLKSFLETLPNEKHYKYFAVKLRLQFLSFSGGPA